MFHDLNDVQMVGRPIRRPKLTMTQTTHELEATRKSLGRDKSLLMKCFVLFDAQEVLFTFRILTAVFMKHVGHKVS